MLSLPIMSIRESKKEKKFNIKKINHERTKQTIIVRRGRLQSQLFHTSFNLLAFAELVTQSLSILLYIVSRVAMCASLCFRGVREDDFDEVQNDLQIYTKTTRLVNFLTNDWAFVLYNIRDHLINSANIFILQSIAARIVLQTDASLLNTNIHPRFL